MLQKFIRKTSGRSWTKSSRHDSDALVGVSVLHSAIMHDNFRTMEDVVGNVWKKGRLNKDVSNPAPVQLADERIRFGLGTAQRVRKPKLPNFIKGDDKSRMNSEQWYSWIVSPLLGKLSLQPCAMLQQLPLSTLKSRVQSWLKQLEENLSPKTRQRKLT